VRPIWANWASKTLSPVLKQAHIEVEKMNGDGSGFFAFRVAVSMLVLSAASASAQMERVSVALDGTEANHNSYEAALSDNGSVIAFRSSADNLIPGDDNELPDVYVRDYGADTLEWANVDPEDGTVISYGFYRNAYFPSVSDDGNRISFNRYPGLPEFSIRDRTANTTTNLLGPGGGAEREEPQLSGNGQFMVFHNPFNFQGSQPETVRPINDDVNQAFDVFFYDVTAADMVPLERVSRPDFSADLSCISASPPDCPEANGDSMSASVSDDGARVAFYSYATDLVADDTNGFEDVFVKFRVDDQGTPLGIAGPIVRASVATGGTQSDGDSYDPMLSGNGESVAFRSLASNLVANDTNGVWDIFVHEIGTGTTERVSVATDGTPGNRGSFSPQISDDGRFVVFRSNATNLAPDDTNERFDIFVHDRQSDQTQRVSLSDGGGEADNHSYQPGISGDGTCIVFESDATNLVDDDTNRARDIFLTPNPLADSPCLAGEGR
jgi:Tol biopolymer transport system component